MVVRAGGSDLVCVAVPGLCSLVTVAAPFVGALATWADVDAASISTVSASAASADAAGLGSPLAGRVDILNRDCNE